MDLDQAVREEWRERKEEAERNFKTDVRNSLAVICNLSDQLEREKKKLREMKYVEPQFPDLGTEVVVG
jgi:glutaredoxin 2